MVGSVSKSISIQRQHILPSQCTYSQLEHSVSSETIGWRDNRLGLSRKLIGVSVCWAFFRLGGMKWICEHKQVSNMGSWVLASQWSIYLYEVNVHWATGYVCISHSRPTTFISSPQMFGGLERCYAYLLSQSVMLKAISPCEGARCICVACVRKGRRKSSFDAVCEVHYPTALNPSTSRRWRSNWP